MKTQSLFATLLLALSSTALAGGGGPIIHSPDHARFDGYECINNDSYRREGAAQIDAAAPSRLRLFEDNITAKIGSCNVSLTVDWEGPKIDQIFDSLVILDAESTCAAGVEKVSHIFPVGEAVHRGWFAKDSTNILGLELSKEAFPEACAADATPFAMFKYL